ncbi:MAG: hypothetical protein V4538_15625 [Bacteroidota bacterium]
MAQAIVQLGGKDLAFFNANPTLVLELNQHLYLLDGAAPYESAFVIGDGVTALAVLPWRGVVSALTTPFELMSTISGTTLNLAHTPISRQNYYLNGQRCGIGAGKIILSIVGTLVTFDQDYTGSDFEETYDY